MQKKTLAHLKGDWVGSKDGLDVLEKEKKTVFPAG
jgi:hypothetical protein